MVCCVDYIVLLLDSHYEGWETVDCLFFISATISTVGFGDFAPTNDASKVFTIFFIITSLIFVLTTLVNSANG